MRPTAEELFEDMRRGWDRPGRSSGYQEPGLPVGLALIVIVVPMALYCCWVYR